MLLGLLQQALAQTGDELWAAMSKRRGQTGDELGGDELGGDEQGSAELAKCAETSDLASFVYRAF
jgi:hypothetical protein